jgi:hypothetical protein
MDLKGSEPMDFKGSEPLRDFGSEPTQPPCSQALVAPQKEHVLPATSEV